MRTRAIVLMPADCSIQQEARQVAMGADCVLRDPLRVEVLLAYLTRYRTPQPQRTGAAEPQSPTYDFAGVRVSPHEHRLARAGRSIQTTPRVIELLQLLRDRTGSVIPYPLIYSEVFGRRYTGDTSNCRVLLAKTATDFRRLGVNLRKYVSVIAKSGYKYAPDP